MHHLSLESMSQIAEKVKFIEMILQTLDFEKFVTYTLDKNGQAKMYVVRLIRQLFYAKMNDRLN